MPRSIHPREHAGTAVEITQGLDTAFSHLTIGQPAVILVLEGSKTLRWTEGSLEIQAGEAVAIAAGSALDISNHPSASGQYRAQWVVFDTTLCEAFPATDPTLQEIRPCLSLSRFDASPRESFDRALTALRDESLPISVIQCRLQELLAWIAHRGARFATAGHATLTMRLRKLLAPRLSHAWTAPEAARELSLSEASLRRILAREGNSFSGLLREARLEFALTLVQASELPIETIAMEVGYDSASRFSGRFRERFGVTPSQLRGHARAIERNGAEVDRIG